MRSIIVCLSPFMKLYIYQAVEVALKIVILTTVTTIPIVMEILEISGNFKIHEKILNVMEYLIQ